MPKYNLFGAEIEIEKGGDKATARKDGVTEHFETVFVDGQPFGPTAQVQAQRWARDCKPQKPAPKAKRTKPEAEVTDGQ